MLNGGRSALHSGYRRQTHEENDEKYDKKEQHASKSLLLTGRKCEIERMVCGAKTEHVRNTYEESTSPTGLSMRSTIGAFRSSPRSKGTLAGLGGLLKLWFTNDPRTEEFGEATIRAVLSKIEHTQDEMLDVMRFIVMPRSARKKWDH